MKNKFGSQKPSKDELFIRYYLESQNFKLKSEVRLDNLKGDEGYSYRLADFFLPRLSIYIEYYGMYNSSKKKRQEYEQKTEVYFKNKIPTVILYPHELGYLDYAFHTKMLKLLRHPKFRNNWNIFRYKLNRYFNNGKGYFFFLSLVVLIISMSALVESKKTPDFFFILYIIGFATSAVLLMRFFQNIYTIFFKDS